MFGSGKSTVINVTRTNKHSNVVTFVCTVSIMLSYHMQGIYIAILYIQLSACDLL